MVDSHSYLDNLSALHNNMIIIIGQEISVSMIYKLINVSK